MTIKEVTAKAGSLSGYFGYIILLFGWFVLNDWVSTSQPQMSGAIGPVLDWGLRLLAAPMVYAVVFGGIHERQEIEDSFERNGFFSPIKSHFWRLIAANFLYYSTSYLIVIIVLVAAGSGSTGHNHDVLLGIMSGCISTITLFWFTGIVVERKIGRGLIRSIKTLLFNPMALTIGILWAVAMIVDTLAFDIQDTPTPMAINLLRSGVLAVLKVLAIMYVHAIYKNRWGILPENVEGQTAQGEPPSTQPGDKLVNASFGFTFVSFLPLLHLVALILGWLALKRSQRFSLKAATACGVGGFFTLIYFLVVAGLLVGRINPLRAPGYGFLGKANAEIGTYVKLLDQGAYQQIQAQLGSTLASNVPDRHWTFDTALALAKYEDNNLEGALHDFYIALNKKPERGEFYYYYGMALLDNNKYDMALDQFRQALQHDPGLKIAGQYIALIQTAYKPTMVTTALMYILILMILFGLHEYGHAFAAWKLGDDTAKDVGRLTLNPIAHLDLLGSIVLPAILILSQSHTIFGWAKPVPINPDNFKNPKRDHMLVSFAGPAVNLMVSMACLVILGLILLFIRVLWPESMSMNLAAPYSTFSITGTPLASWVLMIIVFFKQMFYTSLILGFFNLIPIPPLDGSWILAGLLPEGLRDLYLQIRRFGFMIFALLAMTPVVGYILSIPINIAWLGLDVLAYGLGFA